MKTTMLIIPWLKRAYVPAQMLNCCIERKRARDEARKVLEGSRETEHKTSGSGQNSCPSPESATGTATASTSAREVSPGKSWDSWSDSEDEFFECLSDQGEVEAPHTEGEKNGSKAEGRLHPYNNMTLLNSTEPLYVPVTQVRPFSFCLCIFHPHIHTHIHEVFYSFIYYPLRVVREAGANPS